jgi:hypothetical protein
MKMEIEYINEPSVRILIRRCQRHNHIQQVALSTYHDCLTQICFTCKKIRTSMDSQETKSDDSKNAVLVETDSRPESPQETSKKSFSRLAPEGVSSTQDELCKCGHNKFGMHYDNGSGACMMCTCSKFRLDTKNETEESTDSKIKKEIDKDYLNTRQDEGGEDDK